MASLGKLVFSGCFLSLLLQPASSLVQELEKGQAAATQKDYDRAVEHFSAAKLADPLDPRPYVFSALAYRQMKRQAAALDEISEAIRLDPTNSDFQLFRIDLLREMGRDNEAASHLAAFLDESLLRQLQPGELWLLANAAFALEKPDVAGKGLDLYEQHLPDNPAARYLRGNIYLKTGEFEKAEQAFKFVSEKARQKHLGHFGLGMTYFAQGRLEESAEHFQQAFGAQPERLPYRLQYAETLLRLGRSKEAFEVIHPVSEQGKNTPRIYYLLGRILRQLDRKEEARQYLSKFQTVTAQMEAETRNQEARNRLVSESLDLLEQNKPQEAVGKLKELLSGDPEDWPAHLLMARAYTRLNEPEAAERHLQKMLELRPDSFQGNSMFAQHWLQRNQPERALDFAIRALRIRPSSADLRNLLGHIYLALSDKEKAITNFKAAVDLAPETEKFLVDLKEVCPPGC